MRLGYSITSATPREKTPREAAAALIDRAAAAEAAGVDYVQAGDHHAMADEHYFQNVPTIGRLSGIFDQVATLFLLPLYDPVFVAEYAGTIDALAHASDVWCTVGWRDEGFAAFDVPKDERGARFEESLTVIQRLWDEEEVTFDGEFYTLDGVSVNPKADPRVCIGGSAEAAVRRAGRRGDAWVGHPGVGLDELETMIGWFEDAGGGEVVVRRDALVRRDGDEARDAASGLLARGYRGWPEDADWGLVGDAVDVAEQLAALRDIGVDEVTVRPMQNDARTLVEVARARDML